MPSTVPGEVDACSLVTKATIEDVLGGRVRSELIAAVGGGTTCDHRVEGSTRVLSVFVFRADTEGADVTGREAYIRFRAEAAQPADDVAGIGDEAFYDGSRLGARRGDVYVDATILRAEGDPRPVLERVVREALRSAVARSG